MLVNPLITQVMMMAPTTAPQTEPPPISIMTIGRMAAVKVKAAGVTAMVTKANRPPARPQMTALVTKASSFQFAVRTPSVDEAISLVAMPAQGPAHAVLESPVDEQDHEDGDHPDQVVLAQVAAEVEAEDVEGGDRSEPIVEPVTVRSWVTSTRKIWPRPMVASAR